MFNKLDIFEIKELFSIIYSQAYPTYVCPEWKQLQNLSFVIFQNGPKGA